MNVVPTSIPDVKLLSPRRFGDHRGFLSETYSRRRLAEFGIDLQFIQDNHSYSAPADVVRGLHYQMPPFAQGKLVRVVRGAILDVALDIRRRSPTFGKHVTARISVEEWNQILVPAGFAHGFCTLEPDTEVLYKVTADYSPEHERGILWNDAELGIEWPVSESDAVVSDKDRRNPRWSETSDLFD